MSRNRKGCVRAHENSAGMTRVFYNPGLPADGQKTEKLTERIVVTSRRSRAEDADRGCSARCKALVISAASVSERWQAAGVGPTASNKRHAS